jgi:tRNA G18 (ribose-2'-O)-methylase SpoU
VPVGSHKLIESGRNEIFRDLKKLNTGREVRRQGRTLAAGSKLARELAADFPELCEAWLTTRDLPGPPEGAPERLRWYRLAPALFRELDTFGTGAPLLLLRVPELPAWLPEHGFDPGCTLLVPFQDPENVGSAIRSAAAFGVTAAVVLAEGAHPYHPKALRASGGNAPRIRILQGPALAALTPDLPIVPLSAEGRDVGTVEFPEAFGLLPGLEGPGLPDRWRERAVSIPIRPGVESLNAAAATAVALYEWSRAAGITRSSSEL